MMTSERKKHIDENFEREEYLQDKYENIETTLPIQERVLRHRMEQCGEGLIDDPHHHWGVPFVYTAPTRAKEFILIYSLGFQKICHLCLEK